MLKGITKLAMAAALMAALAVPAAATAGAWKHHNSAITGNKVVSLTGTIKIHGLQVGSVECQTTGSLTLLAGGSSTGNLTQLTPDLDEKDSTVTTKCVALGFLSGCSVHSVQAKGLNWTIHNNTESVSITTGDIHVTMTGGFCAAHEFTVTPDVITATPNVSTNPPQGHTVNEFTLSGIAVTHVIKDGKTIRTQNAFITGTQEILDNTAGGGDSKPGTYSLT